LLILYMRYFSSVFRCFPFLSIFLISIVSVMLPYECPVFNMWLEYPDLLLLFVMSLMFFVSGVKWSSCLSYVFHWAAHALHLVYVVLFIFVCLCIWFQYVLYGVFHFECNFYMCIFKVLR
jgi:hypothetical protein